MQMNAKTKATVHTTSQAIDVAEWFMNLELGKSRRYVGERSPVLTISDSLGHKPIIEIAINGKEEQQLVLANDDWAKSQSIGKGITVKGLLSESVYAGVRAAALGTKR